MRALALSRLPLERAVVPLLTVGSITVLVLVLAYWTWTWFAPVAEPRARAAAPDGGGIATAGALFGALQSARAAAAPTGLAIQLLGVVAATAGREGYAVMQLDAKRTLVVLEGDEVDPGIRLAEVRPDHVVLDRGGVRETLAWQKRPRPNAAPVAAPVARARKAKSR